jgi:hypothetical protein
MAQLRRLKITVNSDHYPTEPERVAYAVSHLRGDALVQVAAYIEKNGPTSTTNVGLHCGNLSHPAYSPKAPRFQVHSPTQFTPLP